MNTLLDKMKADERQAAIAYDLNRVHTWQRTPSKGYNLVGYARRKPSPLLTLWRALRGVLGV